MHQELEKKRDRIRQERVNSYERKEQIRMSMIESKLKEGLNVKFHLKNGFKNRDHRLKSDMSIKLEKIRKIKGNHQKSSQAKIERDVQQLDSNKRRVDTFMVNQDKRASSNIGKMKKLEKQEQEIMERLKNTLHMQQQAFQDFESLVLTKDSTQKEDYKE
mmetsp:Transcript_4589/g.3862  ORF Transcript_4589/g.3862 Transcript_4589/m.3862 type:complete len:160 (+) Transcript_4589:316-795(+)